MNVVQGMKRSWPSLVVYTLVQFGTFFLATAALERFGWTRSQREPIAGVIAFFALVLVWVVEAVLGERAQHQGPEQH